MEKKQCIVITLPESLAELPIRIERDADCQGIIFNLSPEEAIRLTTDEDKYLFIWRQTDYLKVERDEILWIEANGSYCQLHLKGNRTLLISFHLRIVENDLPKNDFIRIHRSYIINLRNVVSLIGNSVKIGDTLIPIGRDYRKAFFEHFIFLGVRRSGKG